ncbi:TTN [Mytilus coruscus]|uniref:TTN n=1 Tax=Mytilus coruscus TaxID=42192 RepID=A0A6J8EXZ6_MYTCO|nr:TTN [Mytilus coruscus]
MRIFVLSSSKVSGTIWITEFKGHQEHIHCIPSVAVIKFFERPVNTTGFICEFQIQNTTLKDFQNYTVDIENKCGKNTVEIALILADLGKPEKPKSVVINSNSKYIFLQWQSGLNVGSRQSFIIQYRKRSSSAWEYIKAENSNKTNHSIYILNLEPSTKYEVRLYASSELGNSTYTKHIISTKNKKETQNQERSSMNNGLDPQNLNYVEVMFDITTHNGVFCIHGSDARTTYADIDFSARADPLIILEENEESLSSCSVENDDCVSLEEVQQWMISKE